PCSGGRRAGRLEQGHRQGRFGEGRRHDRRREEGGRQGGKDEQEEGAESEGPLTERSSAARPCTVCGPRRESFTRTRRGAPPCRGRTPRAHGRACSPAA